ncbi:MAG: tetratricopeptide repeat protein [Planctomycetota bacterium]
MLEPRLDALFASDHPLAGGCLNGLGRLALRAERGEEALRCFTAALQKARALNPESDVGIVAILANLGSAASAAGRDAEAEARCREAVSTARSSAAAAVRGELGVALHALAATLKKQGKLVAAEAAARESLDERIAHLGSEHLDVAESQSLLARLLYARAEYDQAEPLFRAALATRQKFLQPPHPLLAQSENYLAELLRERQLLPEAEALQESALEMRRELYGARHVEVAESLTNLAKIRHERKDPKARELFAAALAIARELSDQPSFRVMCMNNLVACLIDDQDLAAAEPLAREALESSRTNLPGDHIMGAFAARNLGRVCELNHALAEAESCFRDSYETFARVRGDRHPETLWLLRHLIQICRKLGRNDEAERYGTLLKAAGAARGS